MLEEDILMAYDAAWDENMAKQEAKQPDHSMWIVGGKKSREKDIEQRRELGRQQTIDYVDLNPPGADFRPIEMIPDEYGVEIGFELDFDGVKVVGFIDQIREMEGRDDLFPIDVKTGTKTPSDAYQMATYKIAIEEMTGRPVNYGYWWMCKEGGLSKPIDLRNHTRDVVAGWYKALDTGIKNGVFLGNPGDACFTCLVKPHCSGVRA